jgi:hypothetical protein
MQHDCALIFKSTATNQNDATHKSFIVHGFSDGNAMYQIPIWIPSPTGSSKHLTLHCLAKEESTSNVSVLMDNRSDLIARLKLEFGADRTLTRKKKN